MCRARTFSKLWNFEISWTVLSNVGNKTVQYRALRIEEFRHSIGKFKHARLGSCYTQKAQVLTVVGTNRTSSRLLFARPVSSSPCEIDFYHGEYKRLRQRHQIRKWHHWTHYVHQFSHLTQLNGAVIYKLFNGFWSICQSNVRGPSFSKTDLVETSHVSIQHTVTHRNRHWTTYTPIAYLKHTLTYRFWYGTGQIYALYRTVL